MEIIRASELADQAGAFYVRIQAMARQHKIPLHEEFDEHDTPETKYIVIIDDYVPVATCRMYQVDSTRVKVGRVCVLEEYRGQGLGRKTIEECEKWARELGYEKVMLEARLGREGFYETMGYEAYPERMVYGDTFICMHMEKIIS